MHNTRTHMHLCSLTLSPLAKPTVSRSSSDLLATDSIIRKPLLVAPSTGEQVTLFAEVTAEPCPTVQWMVNGSAVSNAGNYTIGNPCFGSPAGITTFNFTLAITATSATAGTYNATLINSAGTANISDVFVTPPGALAPQKYSHWF